MNIQDFFLFLLVNLALKKRTISTVFGGNVPSLAVDGNLSQSYYSCGHTVFGYGQKVAWWQVAHQTNMINSAIPEIVGALFGGLGTDYSVIQTDRIKETSHVLSAFNTTILMMGNIKNEVAEKIRNGTLQNQYKVTCFQYWPVPSSILACLDYEIIPVEEQRRSEFITRKLHVKNTKTGEIRHVCHLQFTSWPRQGYPIPYQLFLLHRKCTEINSTNNSAPVIVHCSDGIDRTGIFIAFDVISKCFYRNEAIDICMFVTEMRKKRINMVATEMLMNNLPEYDDKVYKEAILAKNRGKHRNQIETYRLNINKGGAGHYVNAVAIPSCRMSEQFLVTQIPLISTMADLWRLIFEYNSCTIVNLEDEPSFEKEKNNERFIKLFRYSNWKPSCITPTPQTSFLDLIHLVLTWNKSINNGPITVICSSNTTSVTALYKNIWKQFNYIVILNKEFDTAPKSKENIDLLLTVRRLNGFQISVGLDTEWQNETSCYSDNDPDYPPNITTIYECTGPGRYVTIFNYNYDALDKDYGPILELCEVQVFACVNNTFGERCNTTCHCNQGTCNNTNGDCFIKGCQSGWEGNNCSTNLGNSSAKGKDDAIMSQSKPDDAHDHVYDELGLPENTGAEYIVVQTNNFQETSFGNSATNTTILMIENIEDEVCEMIKNGTLQKQHKGLNQDSKYIATQGPMKNTVTCFEYWPVSSNVLAGLEYEIILLKEQTRPEFITRELKVKNTKTGEVRKIWHLQFTSWPKQGVPVPFQLLLLHRQYTEIISAKNSGPPIIHCNDGTDRTGVFIAFDAISQCCYKNEAIDICMLVTEMRKNRINMVAKEMLLNNLPEYDDTFYKEAMLKKNRGKHRNQRAIPVLLQHCKGIFGKGSTV
ncbi:hypothetical protein KUTeg_019266 [Tegillarca granosa]|uniref:Uncharacterized protein n=1 Tax=Tegillarca granosa TaxID=220873 RepID=A0ABQ9ECH2_TEGGR|nr:hypothetical protein KUTeg_019266 [Tegillarca granosa]